MLPARGTQKHVHLSRLEQKQPRFVSSMLPGRGKQTHLDFSRHGLIRLCGWSNAFIGQLFCLTYSPFRGQFFLVFVIFRTSTCSYALDAETLRLPDKVSESSSIIHVYSCLTFRTGTPMWQLFFLLLLWLKCFFLRVQAVAWISLVHRSVDGTQDKRRKTQNK